MAEPDKSLDQQSDAEGLLQAINNAVSPARNHYVTTILFVLYAAITAASTTDEQLLRDGPIAVPLLPDSRLAVSAFFTVAPWLIVALHLNLLVNLQGLADKLARFNMALERMQSGGAQLRLRLTIFPFAAWLGADPRVASSTRFLQGLIVWVTVAFAPLTVLMLLQLAFLPFHSQPITWGQRLALTADFGLLMFFWPRLISARMRSPNRLMGLAISLSAKSLRGIRGTKVPATSVANWRYHVSRWLGATARAPVRIFRRILLPPSIAVPGWILIGVAFTAATIPDEPLETALVHIGLSKHFGPKFALHVEDIESAVPPPAGISADLNIGQRDEKICIRLFAWLHLDPNSVVPVRANCAALLLNSDQFPFHRTLVLTERTLTANSIPPNKIAALDDAQSPEELQKMLAGVQGLDLRGRDLRYADFSFAKLPKADIRQANLQNAYLQGAVLYGLVADDAQLQGAYLQSARLSLARAWRVHLDGADMSLAFLQGATLSDASMLGTDLEKASMQGAILSGAHLEGADLTGSRLQGAYLEGAHLEGASLVVADLEGARLVGAGLQAVDIRGANLDGANLSGAKLQGATFFAIGKYLIRLDGNAETGFYGIDKYTLQSFKALPPSLISRGAQGAAISRMKQRNFNKTVGFKGYRCVGPKEACRHAATQIKARSFGDLIATLSCDHFTSPFAAKGIVVHSVLGISGEAKDPTKFFSDLSKGTYTPLNSDAMKQAARKILTTCATRLDARTRGLLTQQTNGLN